VTTAADCQNCGVPLAGAYCSACGQKGDVRVPSLAALVGDALGDLFNFDSRIWRSLVALVFKPGGLTAAYLAGQRARYAPPFRMYVITSLTFFVLFSFVRLTAPSTDEAAAAINETAASIDASVNAAVAEALEGAGVREPEQSEPPNAEPGAFNVTLDDDGGWNCAIDQGLDPAMRARLEAACRKIEGDSGASFGRAFVDNVPVMMLVFIPIVAALMKVLYLFARRKYVEHLVFFLHLHTFFFLIALVTLVTGRTAERLAWFEWPATIVGYAAWIYFPVYVYVAMRRVYAQGHAMTMAKYLTLGVGYFLAFMLTLLGLIVFTAVTL
jgi:hypothetical protein